MSLSRKYGESSFLPQVYRDKVDQALAEWKSLGNSGRLWAGDASVWTGKDEGQWLGWLGIIEDQLAHIQRLDELAAEVQKEQPSHVLLLGMGGSSLCPEVLKMTFGKISGFPEVHVLDSTVPAQVRTLEHKVDLQNTWFIVSSKSGSTLEPNIFKEHFFKRVQEATQTEDVGNRFIAITDPGSQLERVARNDRFRHIFYGVPTIGGRYSALSHFGTVPAALMGVDVHRLLDRANEMAVSCSRSVPAEENPGVTLGTMLGVLASNGRDKVTLISSAAIADLGAWLEQLLAESTGKEGKGLIPVDREPLGSPEAYGDDRVFVSMRLDGDASDDPALEALERAGHPVIRIPLSDAYDLGREFFRWEMATAVAGSILGIHPFDQPDVEASKVATRELTSAFEQTGSLPPQEPIFREGGIELYTDDPNAEALASGMGSGRSLRQYLEAHVGRLGPGDYFGILAYVEMNTEHEEALQNLRVQIRDRYRSATCVGFGPRFLHSTGQAYKGGPNSGVFLQITCDDPEDVPVPGRRYGFSTVKAAQAGGDFQVLAERGRRVLRVHVGSQLENLISVFPEWMRKADDGER